MSNSDLNITIRLLQELKSRCSEFTRDALIREYEYPTLYQQLRIAIGAEGSQRAHITLRAQPQAYGAEPWYDFVEVVVEEDRGNSIGIVKAHYAAECLCFIDLTRKSGVVDFSEHRGARERKVGDNEEEEELDSGYNSSDDDIAPENAADELPATSMLAFVRFYVNALTDAERGNRPEYRYGDLSNTHKSLPFAMVHVDPNLQARYGLIDTEQIQQGLWVQRDFQDPARFWVLKMT